MRCNAIQDCDGKISHVDESVILIPQFSKKIFEAREAFVQFSTFPFIPFYNHYPFSVVSLKKNTKNTIGMLLDF